MLRKFANLHTGKRAVILEIHAEQADAAIGESTYIRYAGYRDHPQDAVDHICLGMNDPVDTQSDPVEGLLELFEFGGPQADCLERVRGDIVGDHAGEHIGFIVLCTGHEHIGFHEPGPLPVCNAVHLAMYNPGVDFLAEMRTTRFILFDQDQVMTLARQTPGNIFGAMATPSKKYSHFL